MAWQAEAIALAEVNLPDTTGDVPLLPGLFANIRTLAAQTLPGVELTALSSYLLAAETRTAN